MGKACLKLITVVSLIFYSFYFSFVLAATLSLTNIGALGTGGSTYTEWWYTGINPSLSGVSGANAEVSVSIDGEITTTTADGSGNWSTSTSMDQGDHTIIISSGSETYSFTLHTGQNMPDTVTTPTGETTQSTGTVPPTGSSQLIGMLVSATLVGAGFYLFVLGKKDKKKAYVKSVLDSLD